MDKNNKLGLTVGARGRKGRGEQQGEIWTTVIEQQLKTEKNKIK